MTDIVTCLRAYVESTDYMNAEGLCADAATAIEVLLGERDHARARVESAVRLLTGIHLLLYPAPVTTPDGRTLVFRPKDPDPHEVLQELSDRIRALPDALAKLADSP